ncbi:hypothetical protein D3C79_682480 [compost metagenome]
MTDRELLELAAKAAGLKINQAFQAQRDAAMNPVKASLWIDDGSTAWNPLTDDGHALRLAVTLGLTLRLNQFEQWTQAFVGDCYCRGATAVSEHIGRTRPGQNIEQATRRAIVRAAAEIGKAMQEKH